jgi:phage terminase Nu1 subunit (DNA packaging protein)
MTQAELARALRLTPARVCVLVRRGMPTDTVEAAAAWRQANVLPYVRTSAPPAAPAPRADAAAPALDVAQERALLLRAQRREAEHRLRVAQGRYVLLEHMTATLAAVSAAIAERLDALPGDLRRACPELNAETLDRMRAAVSRARNEAADLVPQAVARVNDTFDGYPDDDEDDTAGTEARAQAAAGA